MSAKHDDDEGLLERVTELEAKLAAAEARIAALEARPVYVPQPIYVQPVVVPAPAPYVPPYIPWYTTCGTEVTMTAGGGWWADAPTYPDFACTRVFTTGQHSVMS